jgi:hypothetical protein
MWICPIWGKISNCDFCQFPVDDVTSESRASDRIECSVPRRADGAKQRRVDNPLTERVDEGHVDGRKAADVADVNSEIEAVGVCCFDHGAQGRSVRSPIDQLKKLFVLEPVDDTEEALRRSGWNKGLGTVGQCHTRSKGLARG